MNETHDWDGHVFTVYWPNEFGKLDEAGVYVFALQEAGEWVALYVGESECFRERFANHEHWQDAVHSGASHVHALNIPKRSERKEIERFLIKYLDPYFNRE